MIFIFIFRELLSEKQIGPTSIDWDLLANSEAFLKSQNNLIQMDKLSTDFMWNLNRLIEISQATMIGSNALPQKNDLLKNNTIGKSLASQPLQARIAVPSAQRQKQIQTNTRLMNPPALYNSQFIPQAQSFTPYFLHQPNTLHNQKQYNGLNTVYSNNSQVNYTKQLGRTIYPNRFYSQNCQTMNN